MRSPEVKRSNNFDLVQNIACRYTNTLTCHEQAYIVSFAPVGCRRIWTCRYPATTLSYPRCKLCL